MNVAVVGLGLIGGSIARGLTESGFAACVYGYDLDPDVVDLAYDRGAIQGRLNPGLHGFEVGIWVIAVPPLSVMDWLEQIDAVSSGDSVVTDVTSVKQYVMERVPEGLHGRFVGGHPIAGRREHGLLASRPDLFDSQPWILCPELADTESYRRVERMVFALDANPVQMSAKEHDEHVALISHLPNLLANLLAARLNGSPHSDVVGGSWADLTRLAGSNPELWSQILQANEAPLLGAIEGLRSQLDICEKAVIAGDHAALKALMNRGLDV